MASRTSDMIRRFNRDTVWIATAVLGAVIFAALALAVQVQVRRQKKHDLTQEARQVERDLLLNAYPATGFTGVGLNGNGSIGTIHDSSSTRFLDPDSKIVHSGVANRN